MAVSLKKLSELAAVSGCEEEARNFVLTTVCDRCDNVEIDAMGNVIAFKKGCSDQHKIMLGTNMDESGFIVSEITDKGYLKFKPVGKIDPRTVISKRVVIGADKIKGVIGMKAIHLQKKSEREAAVDIGDLYIDIGERSKKKAEKRVHMGDYITFDTKFAELGEIVKGKALTRFGTVCLIEAMREPPAYDTYFVFSTQRNISGSMGRGIRTAAYKIRPDYALIVDCMDSGDSYKNETPSARLGKGEVIEYMDRTNISDVRFTNALKTHMGDIPMQDKTASVMNTIAGAVSTAAGGTVCACVGIPCRYADTPVSMMNIKDIDAASRVCAAFVKESDVIINEIAQKID